MQIQQCKNMMRQVQNSNNPQQALQNILLNNPNTQALSQMVRMYHGDLQAIAQYMANMRGINLNSLMQELQN